MINLNNFRPDFGMHCKATNKTSLKVSAMYFGEQLLSAVVNKIPQRQGEFTMEVDGMCATFEISGEVREKILIQTLPTLIAHCSTLYLFQHLFNTKNSNSCAEIKRIKTQWHQIEVL